MELAGDCYSVFGDYDVRFMALAERDTGYDWL
jgi:hypothetical protein